MPGCAAVGCNNRSEKGFTMKCFPRDPVLRNIWKKRVGRADWEPSNNSFLCSSHFDNAQWLLSTNGKVKLKKDAIPSIFKITSTRKSPKKRQKVGLSRFENTDMEQYEIEYLDSSSPVFLNFANQKSMPNIINIQSQDSQITGQILQNISILNGETLKNLQNENIIIVADEHNREIGKIVKDTSFMLLEDVRDKENYQIASKPEKSTSGDVKIEVKEEVQVIDYDALEKKLQAICHETDSNDSKDSFKRTRNHNASRGSSFCLEEVDNTSESTREASVQEVECDTKTEWTKHKRKIKIKSTDKIVTINPQKISQSSNKTNGTHFNKDARDIINDLEDIEESKVLPNRRFPIIKSNQASGSKIIIKNNINLSNKNVTVLPVNCKKNDFDVKNVNNVKKPTQDQLTDKVDMQAEVIQRLTRDLLMYKDMESHVKRLSGELEIKNKKIEVLMSKVVTSPSPVEKKLKVNPSLHNASKSDLIERIIELEDQVKNLNKTRKEEINSRKQAECKLKSKEKIVKEQNWKLERASKIIERTEKNYNNYKKRTYELKAMLKRQKVMNNKDTVFDKIFMCYVNQEFTKDVLKTVLDIKAACGTHGYQKLLNCNFPLPSSRVLNKKNEMIKKEVDIVENDETGANDCEFVIDSKPVEINNKSVVKKYEPVENNNESTEDVKNNKESVENKEFIDYYVEHTQENQESVENTNVSMDVDWAPSEDNTEFINNDSKVRISSEVDEDVKMEEVEYLDPEFLEKPREMMVQTVQDIFDDCSDDEDFNILKKHILMEESGSHTS